MHEQEEKEIVGKEERWQGVRRGRRCLAGGGRARRLRFVGLAAGQQGDLLPGQWPGQIGHGPTGGEEVGLVGSFEFAAKLVNDGTNAVAVHTIDQMGWDSNGDRLVEVERPDTGLNNGKIAIWLFLATEVMLFGALFATYIMLRVGAPDWAGMTHDEHGKLILNVPMAFTNTLVLIASSVTMVMSWASLARNRFGAFRMYMGTTVLLGLVFLVIKYFEYSAKFDHDLYEGEEIDDAGQKSLRTLATDLSKSYARSRDLDAGFTERTSMNCLQGRMGLDGHTLPVTSVAWRNHPTDEKKAQVVSGAQDQRSLYFEVKKPVPSKFMRWNNIGEDAAAEGMKMSQ